MSERVLNLKTVIVTQGPLQAGGNSVKKQAWPKSLTFVDLLLLCESTFLLVANFIGTDFNYYSSAVSSFDHLFTPKVQPFGGD